MFIVYQIIYKLKILSITKKVVIQIKSLQNLIIFNNIAIEHYDKQLNRKDTVIEKHKNKRQKNKKLQAS